MKEEDNYLATCDHDPEALQLFLAHEKMRSGSKK
jgi:hypothetical protein